MIDFFFTRKPIYLDCFTSKPAVHDYAPIQLANHFLPEWWKALPKTYFEADMSPPVPRPTMRKCTGLIDIYSVGLMIPMWSDLGVEVKENGEYFWRYADQESISSFHGAQQAGTLFDDANLVHMKIISPWLFSCKEDVKWYFTQPVWNHNLTNNFCIPSGVLEFKYQNTTNINMMLRKQNNVFIISHGTPMVHIAPLSERPIKIKNHLLSEEELIKRRVAHRPVYFENSYYKKRKAMQEKEAKCPFGFGK